MRDHATYPSIFLTYLYNSFLTLHIDGVEGDAVPLDDPEDELHVVEPRPLRLARVRAAERHRLRHRDRHRRRQVQSGRIKRVWSLKSLPQRFTAVQLEAQNSQKPSEHNFEP